MKERFTIQVSSLGDYFGATQTSIEDRLAFDLGEKEQEFDDKARDRMNLGRCLESGILDFFEHKLQTKIINRNTETLTFANGMLRGRIDGECIYQGEPTIVECKDSNSASKFTQNFGYELQCQAYMYAKGYKQALLLGLQNGVPSATLIRRNDDLINDIITVVEYATDILSGILDKSDYCYDIISKYTKKDNTERVCISDLNLDLINHYLQMKDQIKQLKSEIDSIEKDLKERYDNAYYENDKIKLNVSTTTRKGGYNVEMLALEHPEIDLSKYENDPTVSKTLRVTVKKSRN